MRTAIVTGGAAGIGLASAKRLLEDGWRVVALDRDTQALKESSGILAPFGESVRFEALDVTDEPAVAALVLKTTREFGPLRGLITSAGIASNTALFDTSPDLMRRMNEVNVIGTFVIAKAAAQAMRESGGGAIVTIASVSGLVENRGRAAYGASKGAIVNLTRIMAVELAAFSIRVNAIAAGGKRQTQTWSD